MDTFQQHPDTTLIKGRMMEERKDNSEVDKGRRSSLEGFPEAFQVRLVGGEGRQKLHRWSKGRRELLALRIAKTRCSLV